MDRRNGQQHGNDRSILSPPLGLQVFHLLTALNALHHTFFFGEVVLGDDEPDRLPDRFSRAVSKHSLRRTIPRRDAKIQVFAKDRIVA